MQARVVAFVAYCNATMAKPLQWTYGQTRLHVSRGWSFCPAVLVSLRDSGRTDADRAPLAVASRGAARVTARPMRPPLATALLHEAHRHAGRPPRAGARWHALASEPRTLARGGHCGRQDRAWRPLQRCSTDLCGQIGDIEHPWPTRRHQPRHAMLELAHIPRPGIAG